MHKQAKVEGCFLFSECVVVFQVLTYLNISYQIKLNWYAFEHKHNNHHLEELQCWSLDLPVLRESVDFCCCRRLFLCQMDNFPYALTKLLKS